MRIEGEYAVNAEILKLFERLRAVERFTALSLVLAGRIKQGHHDGYSVRLAADSRKNTFDITEVFVGAHAVFIAEKVIGAIVIADVAEDINILAANRIADLYFAFAVVEADFLDRDDVAFTVFFVTKLADELIYLCTELLAALHNDQPHPAVNGILRHFQILLCFHAKICVYIL